MADRNILTFPNVISIVRMLCIPVFVWLLFGADQRIAAGFLLLALGATDWVDGWIARRFDQVSDLGKILDPVADRVLLLTAIIALMVDGALPAWLAVATLAREALVSGATLALALAGAARIDVQWVGKAGTFGLMGAFPAFLVADALDPGAMRDAMEAVSWVAAIPALALSYYAAARYVPLARDALSAGRAARSTQVPA